MKRTANSVGDTLVQRQPDDALRAGARVGGSELLAPVYGWFTEGFDTLDLKEAKALLDELAASENEASPSGPRTTSGLRQRPGGRSD